MTIFVKAIPLLDAVTAAGFGPIRANADYDAPVVEVKGITVDSVQLHGSNKNFNEDVEVADLTPIGTAITADGFTEIPPDIMWIAAEKIGSTDEITARLSGRSHG